MKNSKETIIENAMKLFLQSSYHEVSMQDIVGASGLSKGAFYHYFRSKEQVFEEVIDSFFNHSPIESYNSFSKNSLSEFCEDYVKMVAQRVLQYNLRTGDSTGILRANQYVLIFDAMKLLPNFRANQLALQQSELQHWTSCIAKARKEGEIDTPLSDDQIAKLFIYQNYGIGAYHVLRTQIDVLTLELHSQFEAIYESIKSKRT